VLQKVVGEECDHAANLKIPAMNFIRALMAFFVAF
jgi:hypothetical protein